VTAAPLPATPPESPAAPARGRGLGVALAGLGALAIQLPIFDRWLVVLDEGYVLQLADEINRGKVLYRDVYVDAPFPGAFYLLAAWFRVAGTSIWASRLLMVAAFTVTAVCLHLIARRVLGRAESVALAVLVVCYRIWAFPHWHIVSYSSLAVTFLTAGVALAMAHVRSRSRATLAAAGALVGAGILCKQDYGLGVGGALGLVLLLRPLLARRPADTVRPPLGPLRAALPFAGGAAAVLLPALAALALAGALPGLVEQAVLRPLSAAASFGYTRLPNLSPLLSQDADLRAQVGSYFPAILLTVRWHAIFYSPLYQQTAVWDVAVKCVYYLPLVAFGAALVVWLGAAAVRSLRAAATAEDERRLVLLAWAGGFLLAFNRPRDWVHLMMIYPPALVLALALAHQALRPAPAYLRGAARLVGGALLAVFTLVTLGLVRDLRTTLDWPLRTPRAGVWVDQHHGPVLEDLLGWIAANVPPGAPLPVYPLQPMVGFLADRESVAGFNVIWPVQDPERDTKIIAALQAGNVERMVYSVSQYAHIGSFRQNAPRLFEYLTDHYAITAVFSREVFGSIYTALRRRPPLPGIPLYDVPADWPGDGLTAPRRWPFARVMAERTSPAGAPAIARFRIPVPAGAPRLEVDYGVNPDRWLDPPSGPFTFTVHVEEPDGRPAAELLRATLDPYHRLGDRGWMPARLDLSPWAGRPVTLAFAITAVREPADPLDIAGWASPRVVVE
jgi:hypothetical protein